MRLDTYRSMLALIILFSCVTIATATNSAFGSSASTDEHCLTNINFTNLACDIEFTSSVVHNKCFNDYTGSISLNVTGGTPGYTFSWSNGATGNPVTNLGPGNYSFTITDSQGCTKTGSATVNNGPLIFVKAWIQNADCYTGINGSISLTVSGGVPPYQFLWSNGSTVKDQTNIPAGNYSVTITDNNGCTTVKKYKVEQNSDLDVNGSVINPSCDNPNGGSISQTVSGGTAPYSFLWSNGATTKDLSNLSEGTYSVTVTDVTGCSVVRSYTLVSPSGIQISGIVTDANCAANNGSINISVSGGSPAYSYAWSNGATSEDIANLGAGSYTVTVTDSNGCSKTATYQVGSSAGPSVNGTVTHVSCFGGNDGSVAISVSGGTPAYSYAWSNGASSQNISGLAAGNYTVTVTDANGCTAVKSFSVTQPSQIQISAQVVNATCGLNNGSINISVSGGSPAYSYAWSNGATSEDIANLGAGSYTVTVTDSKGCSKTATYQVGSSSGPSVNGTVTHVSCFGGNDGAVAISVSGGTPAYSYAWSNGASSQNISGLAAGNYIVTVTDANGCTAWHTFTVTQPSQIQISAQVANATCGLNNGSINISVSGGSPAYSYAWSNGATSEDIANLGAGSYTVTVTDSKGCSKTATYQVGSSAGPSVNGTVTHVSCLGGNDGAVAISVSGGAPAYSYAWSNGASSQNISGLAAGNYTVTVTDANGCTAWHTFTVTQPSQIQITAQVLNAACGLNNGSINISVSGGSPAYSYAWSNGATSEDIANLGAGSYTVTVTDSKGCSKTATYQVGSSAGPSVNGTVTHVSCFGGNDGAVAISVSGGTPAYSYTWSNGATSQNISGLVAGNYTLTVTDANGCTEVKSFSVTQPSQIQISAQVVNATCGLNNGSINISVSGGSPAYSYAWSNGATSEDIANLGAGSYTVTVTDSKGCSKTATYQVGSSAGPSVNGTVTHVSCFGGNDGAVAISVSGGTPAYSYAWSNGASSQNISGLAAGNYTVTVTDANGCTAWHTFTVTQPSQIQILAQVVNATCGLNNGSINISVSGGSPAYSYTWSNGATSEDLSNLGAGSYTVTVTDSKGCSKTATYQVGSSAGPSVNGTVTHVSCFGGNDGAVAISVSGGAPAYSYAWSNGASSQNISGLAAGNYIVTVTDANGCTAVKSFSVTQPSQIQISAQVANATCGLNNGSINISVSGGSPAYSYAWSNGATSEDIANLGAGSYTVTVTDSKGCSKTATYQVGSSAGPSVNGTVTHVSCFGGNDGSVAISVSGGTPAYSYAWSNGASSQNISGLAAGNYTVTVTDANGCTAWHTFSVTQSSQIQISAQVANATCGLTNGSINISVSGGSPAYSFAWSNGATSEDIANLGSGSYTVTVTDSKGCSKTATYQVGSSAGPSVYGTVTHVSCFGGNDGAVAISVSGGAPAYSYAWSNGASSQNISGLVAGNYTVTVTDANGCTEVKSFSVTQPSQIQIIAQVLNATCGLNNGSINISVSGGSPAYSYAWSNGATSEDIANLGAGSYTVTVTDSKGCSKTATYQVGSSSGPSVNGTVTHVSCFGGNDGAVAISVSGGTPAYSYAWSNGASSQNISGLAAGNYTVTVTDANGCTAVKSFSVTQPSQIQILAQVVNATCGLNNGSINISVSGGSPAYSYAWSNGATSEDIANLGAGSYTVTVTDSKGCSKTATYQVGSSAGPSVNGTVTHVSCFGGNDGAVAISVSGGTPAYSYAWSNGASSQNISGLAAGNYTVTVTDANGCSAVKSFSVTQPSQIQISAQVVNAACGLNNGSINISVSGGSPAYSYAWSNGASSEDIANLGAGSYTVTVTDSKGCSKTVTYQVGSSAGPSVNGTVTHVSCFGGNDGSVAISVSGGTPAYSYAWSNGASSQNISGLAAGNYTVTVTDANGCTEVKSFSVTQPSQIQIIAQVVNAACGLNNGSINISVSGGSPAYSYAWSNGASSEDIANLGAGSYTVTVTDSKGCSKTATYQVGSSAGPSVNGTVTHVSCFGGNDGSVAISVSGGTPGYSYAWSNGASSQNISGLAAGNYTVTVTDANGCTAVKSFSVTQPSQIQISAQVVNATCGLNNGSINISVSGGSPAYSYAWSNGATSEDIANLGAGSYTVTVTDSNGCSKTATYQVTTSGSINIEENIVHVKCFGGNDGSITIGIINGVPPYSIYWSNGAVNTTSINNLIAGNYSVTVTDAVGCTQVNTYTVNQPPVLTVDGAINHVQCYGQNSGSIILTATGGTPGYSYQWSNGANTKDISGLVSGFYSVTVTDSKGCSTTKSFTVNQQPQLTVSGTSVNPTCYNGNDGSINLSVSGGTPNYSFIWNTGASSEDLNGISSGIYNVTVTDANACTKTASFNLVNPSEIIVTGQITDAACSKATGSINIAVSGGSPAYTYAWSNGAITEDISSLAAGAYSVTVTDSKGCKKTANFVVNDKGGINILGIATDVSCYGGDNGSASINISNATLPVSINWSNGAVNVNSINNLTAGNYSVTVTDAIGCVEIQNFIIQQPPAINLSGTVSHVLCFGGNSGAVALTTTGGTPGYSYLWSNGATSQNISNLVAGNYSVTVTDSKGCTSVKSFIVTQADEMLVNGSTVNPSCYNGSNGSINLTVSAGTPGYSFLWSNGASTEDISGLAAGNYSVTVTDANGCKKTSVFTLSNPSEIQISGSIIHAACFQSNGGINITVSGGSPSYSYAWSNGANTEDLVNIGAGTYTVTVTDSKGCVKTASFQVNDGGGLNINETITHVSCNGGNNGSISVSVTGGTNPYSIVWSNGAVSTFTINNLTAGNYSVTVTDSKQCSATKTITVTQPSAIALSIAKTDIDCYNGNNGTLTANPTGGTAPYSYIWSNGQTTKQIQNLTAGTYTVTVTDANNCTASASAVLTNPAPITIGINAGKTSCYNSADAYINITVGGGTPPYTYIWSNGATTEDLSNLAKGNYTVTVTDSKGCTKVETISIFSPIQMSFDLQVTDETCFNKKDGKISVTNLIGGVPGYTYKWNNPAGSTTPSISNLAPGTYTVTVTDSKGCTEVKSATVNASSLKCTVNIGDYVWLDEDKDGIQDSTEMGVNGIVVHLIDLGPDGILGTGDDIIVDTEYTKNNGTTKGYYYFPDVPAGTYVIMFFVDKDKYTFSPKYQGGDPAKDSNVNPSTGKTDVFTVNVGDQDDLRFDAGIYVYCDNVTSGGVICCDETICTIGGIPKLIESVYPASGGSGGPIEYVWNKSTKNPYYYPNSPDWEMIPNSNTPSYQPGPLTETTYFIRCARREGCGPFVGEANIITKKVVDAKQADILDAPPIICYNMPVTLHSVDYGPDVIYEWHLGYGAVPATGNTPAVTVNWPTPGLKNVQLKVITDGCVSTDIALVAVESCLDMVVNDFTAVLNAELQSSLRWRMNNSGSNIFEILRSQDNVNFTAISSLQGYPDKDGYYSFLDKKPEIGINYYRIKSVASNGLYHISESRSVFVNDGQDRKVAVYPNPASDYITIEPLESDLSAADISLTDVTGRVLKSYKLNEGFKQFDVEVSGLASGVYFVNIKLEGKRPYTYKIIKQE